MTMTQLTVDQMQYTNEQPLPAELRAAEAAASSSAYDPHHEVCVASCVNQVLFLQHAWAQRYFAECLSEAGAGPNERMVRIDWQSWSAPRRFDRFLESGLIERSESVVVTLTQLINNDMEHTGFPHWQELPPVRHAPPKEAFEWLSKMVEDEWSDVIVEHSMDDENFIDRLDPFLRPAVRELLML